MTYTSLNVWSGGEIHNPEGYMKHGITKHNEHIKKLVPKERLLEFHPKDGWKPLCDFLGKEVPEGDFPNINEGSSLKSMLDQLLVIRVWVSLGEWALVAAPVAAAAAGAWWWNSRM